MPLPPETRLGPYTIVSPLGAGGMGEVYRANDSKLGRDVAIKVLPAELAQDSERLARFEREAKLLASLNHPNIAHVYGFEGAVCDDGSAVHFLAMELVEGEDLAERLRRGSIPVDDALAIAKQIAEALEEAHEKGIVHRDLKPANVKVTPDGKVKVLDFGLAKAWSGEAAGAASSADLSQSPTLARTGTQAGVILGTAAYMSPEQARGKPVDKRADIWAFGVVLFEMLTGRKLFEGDTVSDVLAAVLRQEVAWAELPASTPASVRGLLRRCVERDPKRRLRDVGEARIRIDEASAAEDEQPQAAQTGERRRPSRLPWAIAAIGATIGLGSQIALWRGPLGGERAPEEAPTRTSLLMPASNDSEQSPGSFALAPDGTALVFRAAAGSGKRRLYVRELAQPEARPLEGTERAQFPFWSADSHDIGFFADGELRRVPRSGGAVQRICAARTGRGGAWNRDGVIVFAPEPYGPLSRVRASGGEPTAATVVEPETKDASHRFPAFLPDGRHFLFVAEDSQSFGRSWIRVAALDALTAGRRLLDATSAPRFAAPGSLVFQREAALVTQAIDLDRLSLRGEPQLLADRPNLTEGTRGAPVVDLASNGRMLYAPADLRPSALVWLGRDGVERGRLPPQEVSFKDLAISHRGDRVAAFGRSRDGQTALWVIDLERGSGSRITAPELFPWGLAWSADDREIATWLSAPARAESASNEGSLSLVSTANGALRRLLPPSNRWILPLDFSADGRTLLYVELASGRGYDLGWLRLDGEPIPTAYLATLANESRGRLSPDARWLAYLSEASGRREAFVDSFPDPARAQRVALDGEVERLRFRADGRELFLVAAEGDSWAVFACDLRLRVQAEIGPPRKLFSLPPEWSALEPLPSGDRFLLLEPAGGRWPSLTLVENWRSQLALPGESG